MAIKPATPASATPNAADSPSQQSLPLNPPMWAVTLMFTNPKGEMPFISNNSKRIVLEHLAGKLPVLGYGADYVSISFDVPAPDHRVAAAIAHATCDDAFMNAGLPVLPVTECQIVRADRQEAKAMGIPDLMGVSEIADLLGVSKQRAWQYTKSSLFPAAACQLKAGPLWQRRDVLQFTKKRTAG